MCLERSTDELVSIERTKLEAVRKDSIAETKNIISTFLAFSIIGVLALLSLAWALRKLMKKQYLYQEKLRNTLSESIGLVSGPGEGSTFYFDVPLSSRPAPEIQH